MPNPWSCVCILAYSWFVNHYYKVVIEVKNPLSNCDFFLKCDYKAFTIESLPKRSKRILLLLFQMQYYFLSTTCGAWLTTIIAIITLCYILLSRGFVYLLVHYLRLLALQLVTFFKKIKIKPQLVTPNRGRYFFFLMGKRSKSIWD